MKDLPRQSFVKTWKETEHEYFLKLITTYEGKISMMSRSAGMCQNTLYRKIVKHGLKETLRETRDTFLYRWKPK